MMRLSFQGSRARWPLGAHSPMLLLPCLMALTVYSAALGTAGLIAVGDQRRSWDAALADAMTLQIPAEASTARLETVLAMLRQTKGVVRVHLLEPAETARLVEPWFGSAMVVDRLPVPRMVDFRVDGAEAPDFTELRQKLAAILPDARLEEHGALLADLHGGAARLTSILAAFVVCVLLIAVLSAMSAAATGLTRHRELVELLHWLGATDGYIARQFQTPALRLGLVGAGIGAAAAALTMLAFGGAGGFLRLPSPIVAGGIADWRMWLVLAGVVAAAGGIATAAARLTVLRRLADMP
jgi:cell division transport system permease protein